MRPTAMRLPLAVLTLTVLTLALLVGCSSERDQTSVHPAAGGVTTPAPPAAVPVGNWRVESYDRVTLKVPPAWKLGYSPIDQGGASLLCADRQDTPYVGRPEYGSDVCGTLDRLRLADEGFEGEAVWFDSPLPVGTNAHGVPSETREVAGQRVTVAARDGAVRREVLASAVPIGKLDPNGCAVRAAQPDARVPTEGLGKVLSFGVCAYDGDHRLLWSGRRPVSDGEDLLDRVGKAPAAVDLERKRFGPDQRVTLVLRADDPFGAEDITTRLAVSFSPGELHWLGRTVPLTKDLVAPWASDGIRTYVVGGVQGGSSGEQYFRPIWG